MVWESGYTPGGPDGPSPSAARAPLPPDVEISTQPDPAEEGSLRTNVFIPASCYTRAGYRPLGCQSDAGSAGDSRASSDEDLEKVPEARATESRPGLDLPPDTKPISPGGKAPRRRGRRGRSHTRRRSRSRLARMAQSLKTLLLCGMVYSDSDDEGDAGACDNSGGGGGSGHAQQPLLAAATPQVAIDPQLYRDTLQIVMSHLSEMNESGDPRGMDSNMDDFDSDSDSDSDDEGMAAGRAMRRAGAGSEANAAGGFSAFHPGGSPPPSYSDGAQSGTDDDLPDTGEAGILLRHRAGAASSTGRPGSGSLGPLLAGNGGSRHPNHHHHHDHHQSTGRLPYQQPQHGSGPLHGPFSDRPAGALLPVGGRGRARSPHASGSRRPGMPAGPQPPPAGPSAPPPGQRLDYFRPAPGHPQYQSGHVPSPSQPQPQPQPHTGYAPLPGLVPPPSSNPDLVRAQVNYRGWHFTIKNKTNQRVAILVSYDRHERYMTQMSIQMNNLGMALSFTRSLLGLGHPQTEIELNGIKRKTHIKAITRFVYVSAFYERWARAKCPMGPAPPADCPTTWDPEQAPNGMYSPQDPRLWRHGLPPLTSEPGPSPVTPGPAPLPPMVPGPPGYIGPRDDPAQTTAPDAGEAPSARPGRDDEDDDEIPLGGLPGTGELVPARAPRPPRERVWLFRNRICRYNGHITLRLPMFDNIQLVEPIPEDGPIGGGGLPLRSLATVATGTGAYSLGEAGGMLALDPGQERQLHHAPEHVPPGL
ncbi:hypothetical protein H696_02074 [Fonticula alba]|uniref:Uncharacterized protein n=1 Tax=Fonticula alba TaxID=691883 RepID=A0A058ZA03_FONAL|nr:hypothetical protein H696_02074 [Fonticula alba]KCV71124.1 hypothetical protein H696_02074 [Fonticula alba]|eukprot:XP_009494247.1 hypothetical protein H696_02074 [Fonticula alba]